MNSLTELNGYSGQTVPFQDERPYTCIMSNVSGSGSHVAPEGSTVVVYVGANITALNSVTQTANSKPVIYEVSIPQANYTQGARVVWPVVPQGCEYTDFGNGVARLAGISSVVQWNEVKYATIKNVRDSIASYDYTAKIDDLQGNSRTWSGNVTLTNQSEVNTTTLADFSYEENVVEILTTPFQITDLENTDTLDIYEVNVTTNTPASANVRLADGYVSTLAYSGFPSTPPYSGDFFVMRGNKAAINDALTHMVLDPGYDYNQTVIITWRAVNPMAGTHNPDYPNGGVTTTMSHQATCRKINSATTNEGRPRTYVAHTGSKIFPSQPITVTNGGLYMAYFTLSSNSGVLSVYGGDLENSGWNYSTKTLQLNGYQSDINTLLSNLYYLPYYGSNTDQTVNFRLFQYNFASGNWGTEIVNSTFSLKSVSFDTINPGYNYNYLKMTSGTPTPTEDTTFSNLPQLVSPNWSLGFGALIRTRRIINGPYAAPQNALAVPPAGWTALADGTGYYKNFTYTTFAQWEAARSEVSQFQYKLTGDKIYGFVWETTMSSAAHYNASTGVWTPTTKTTSVGTLTAPGTTWNTNTTSNYVNPIPVLDYNVRSSFTYQEDTLTWICGGINESWITDTDTTAGVSYRGSFSFDASGFSVDPTWIINGSPYSGATYVITGNKADLNNTVISMLPPPNWTDTLYMKFSLEKSYDNGLSWTLLTPDPNFGNPDDPSRPTFVYSQIACGINYTDFTVPGSTIATKVNGPVLIPGIGITDAILGMGSDINSPSRTYTLTLTVNNTDAAGLRGIYSDNNNGAQDTNSLSYSGTNSQVNQILSDNPPCLVPYGRLGTFGVSLTITITSQTVAGATTPLNIDIVRDHQIYYSVSEPIVGQAPSTGSGLTYLGKYNPTTGSFGATGTKYLFARRSVGTSVYNYHTAPASAPLPAASNHTYDGKTNTSEFLALWGNFGSTLYNDARTSGDSTAITTPGGYAYMYFFGAPSNNGDFYVPSMTELNAAKPYITSRPYYWTSNMSVTGGVASVSRSDQNFTWAQVIANNPQGYLAVVRSTPVIN